MYLKEISTVIFLAVNGWNDWKKKEILLRSLPVYGAFGIAFSIWQGRKITDMLIPEAVGLGFLILSIGTGGEIGTGDGLIFLALGTMLGTEICLQTLWMGLLAAAVYSGFLLMRRKSRKTEIPFVPFLLLGYMGALLL